MAKTFVIPQDPEKRKQIMSKIREISGSFTRTEGERDYVKKTIELLSEEFQLPKKYLSKFAKDYHKSTNDARETMDEYMELIDALDPPPKDQE